MKEKEKKITTKFIGIDIKCPNGPLAFNSVQASWCVPINSSPLLFFSSSHSSPLLSSPLLCSVLDPEFQIPYEGARIPNPIVRVRRSPESRGGFLLCGGIRSRFGLVWFDPEEEEEEGESDGLGGEGR